MSSGSVSVSSLIAGSGNETPNATLMKLKSNSKFEVTNDLVGGLSCWELLPMCLMISFRFSSFTDRIFISDPNRLGL